MKMMTSAALVLVLASAPAWATVSVSNRTESLINTYQFMCERGLPNFKEIDGQATAMRMPLQDDSSSVAVKDTVTHTKSWLGNSTFGPYGLVIEETKGSRGTLTSCALFGEVADMTAFRASFQKELGLAAPGVTRTEGGATGYEWSPYSGPGTTLILRDLTPSGKSAVMMKLLYMNPDAR